MTRPGLAASILWLAWLLAGSVAAAGAQPDPDPVATGARLFFTETFGGNGRTCATCHPAENNFTLDPAFIAIRPRDDPLFVAEFNPDLADLEDPVLLRRFALIRENVDGFDRPAVLRSVPHTFALSTSVASKDGPATGWSGDGSPDGSLRSFATGAVIQHFPRTLARVPGVDFRLPTEAELDALEAFLLSLGRQADLALPLPLKGSKASLGQAAFLDRSRGKCNLCHVNAGATFDVGTGNAGNLSFDTGVAQLPHPAPEPLPPDGGFGRAPRPGGQGFGDGKFNVPPLVEAAGTPPFFHNNAVDTIEKAVEFYTSPEFAGSPAALGVGAIFLDTTEAEAIAAFLRVINALENIRRAIQDVGLLGVPQPVPSLVDPARDIRTAVRVLSDVGLHPDAVALLEDAGLVVGSCPAADAIARLTAARALMVGPDAGGAVPPAIPVAAASPGASSVACTGFVDVSPRYFAAPWIAALVEAGVTAGCSTDPPLFCPESPVTRDQMAVFLLKAALGAGHTPPACTTAPFGDVPCSSMFAAWIQDLVARGITAGCGGGNYCPGSAVTREQVAVLLLRAVGVTPGACTTAPFTDVPCSSSFAPWIQELVARGITAGCTPTTYCPTNPVTRAQMAIFLAKTFGLPL